jgi:hypothetical protein
MNTQDKRTSEFFTKNTFSLYSKKDVMKQLDECLEHSKIEEGNNWIAECLLSGYVKELVNRIMQFALSRIHINNCTLMSYIITRCEEILIISTGYSDILKSRNDMRTRVLLSEMFSCLCLSQKSLVTKPIKITEKDFSMSSIMENSFATNQPIFKQVLTDTDKVNFPFACNEFCYMLYQKNFYYCNYWIIWLLTYQTKILSKKKDVLYFERSKDTLHEKHQNKMDLVIWECIKGISRAKKDDKRKKVLMEVYKIYYGCNDSLNRKTLTALLLFCCRLFCGEANYKLPIIINTTPLKKIPDQIAKIYEKKINSIKNHPNYWNNTYLTLLEKQKEEKRIKKQKAKERKRAKQEAKANQTAFTQAVSFYDI